MQDHGISGHDLSQPAGLAPSLLLIRSDQNHCVEQKKMFCSAILYYIIVLYIILYYIMLYYIILYYIILYYIIVILYIVSILYDNINIYIWYIWSQCSYSPLIWIYRMVILWPVRCWTVERARLADYSLVNGPPTALTAGDHQSETCGYGFA